MRSTVAHGCPWIAVLDRVAAAQAIAVARHVMQRLRAPAAVEAAATAAREQTAFPRSVRWRPHAVSQGYAGLAILWGGADASLPDEGWDAVGRDHLRVAVAAAEQQPRLGAGLFSGLAGVAFASWSLSRRGTRYRRLLASLDGALLRNVAWATGSGQRPHGVAAGTFDVIAGLGGVGRYLLLRVDEPAHRAALGEVLRVLVALIGDDAGLPHWHTPPQYLVDSVSQERYPHGNLNCGLAHGIPGPLALLSLALSRGVSVEGQARAIRRAAEWLCRHQIRDAWGVNWPTAVPLHPGQDSALDAAPESGVPSAAAAPSRAAWCYGAPGIARALWLAGTALEDEGYRNLAVTAMEAVYHRPLSARNIDSPTFCHGVAGLQQITLRFANESTLPLFVDAAQVLHRQIVDAFEPESLLGYGNLEPGGRRIDQPGLLDGAAGVPLVLMAASTPVEPSWDALFLLS